jgi:hypothetical protein
MDNKDIVEDEKCNCGCNCPVDGDVDWDGDADSECDMDLPFGHFLENPCPVFLCGTDAIYHLGDDAQGVRVFFDTETLNEESPCVEECGIVEMELTFKRWVTPAKPIDETTGTSLAEYNQHAIKKCIQKIDKLQKFLDKLQKEESLNHITEQVTPAQQGVCDERTSEQEAPKS